MSENKEMQGKKADLEKIVTTVEGQASSATRYISLGVAAVALLCAVWFTLSALFTMSDGLEVPTYQAGNSVGLNSDGRKTARKAILKKYEGKIKDIAKVMEYEGDQRENFSDNMESILLSMEADYRSDYLSGLKSYLKDVQSDMKKLDISKKEFSYRGYISDYNDKFEKAQDKIKANDQQASMKRQARWTNVFGSLLVLLAALALPVLVKIEKNTRKA